MYLRTREEITGVRSHVATMKRTEVGIQGCSRKSLRPIRNVFPHNLAHGTEVHGRCNGRVGEFTAGFEERRRAEVHICDSRNCYAAPGPPP